MSDSRYAVVGTRPVRHDGADKVTGRALYGADFQQADLLHGYILRSPHAHARILRIDASSISETAGPAQLYQRQPAGLHQSALPGHAVAAIAAVNRDIAKAAAGLIEVEYQPLPYVLTATAA